VLVVIKYAHAVSHCHKIMVVLRGLQSRIYSGVWECKCMWTTCFTNRSTFPEAVSKLLILFQILESYSTMLKLVISPSGWVHWSPAAI